MIKGSTRAVPETQMDAPDGEFSCRVASLVPEARERFESLCRQIEALFSTSPSPSPRELREISNEFADIRDVVMVHAGRCLMERHRDRREGIPEVLRLFPEIADEAWAVEELKAWACQTRDQLRGGRASDAPHAPFVLPDFLTLIRACTKSGMGQAMVVENRRTKRVEVLKVANDRILASPEALRRFVDEPKRISQFNHPGIVTVYDCSEANGIPYYLMEYMTAGTLEDRLRGGPLPVRQAVEYVRSAAGTMHVIHEKGFIHGDIKPPNMLFTQTDDGAEVLKIGDFGLTRPMPHDWRSRMPPRLQSTFTGIPTAQVTGTPGYVAPEVFEPPGRQNDSAVGKSADVFALGVTLYQCLTGTLPYQDRNDLVDLFGPLINPLRSPAVSNPNIDPSLEAICQRALRKSPEERFHDAKSFASALDHWLSQQPAVLSRTPHDGSAIAEGLRPRRFRAMAGVAVIMTIVLGAGVLVYNSHGVGRGESPVVSSREEWAEVKRLPWPESTKTAFGNSYASWLHAQRSSDVGSRLASVGYRGTSPVTRVIEQEPELAFPLILVQQPDAFAREFLKLDLRDPRRQVLKDLLLLYPRGTASDQLLLAWQAHHDAIYRLWRLQLVGAETAFMLEGQGDGDASYRAWLAEVFSGDAITDDDLAQRLELTLWCGPSVRARLATSTQAERDQFVYELWPRLRKICDSSQGQRPLDIFIAYPLTWEFLGTDYGEPLARQYGPLPADLFVGENAYPAELHPLIKRVLDQKKTRALVGLLSPRLRENPEFIALLRQRANGDPSVLAVAIAQLSDAGDGAAGLLAEFRALSERDWNERISRILDAEIWDDSLNGYFTVASRLVAGKHLTPSDVSIAVVDGLCDLAQFVPDKRIKAAALGARFLNDRFLKPAVGNERAREKQYFGKLTADVSEEALRPQFETLAHEHPSALLRNILAEDAGTRRSMAAGILRFFWKSTGRRDQLDVLAQHTGEIFLSPDGRLICVGGGHASSTAPAINVFDRQIDSRTAAATWWEQRVTEGW